MLPGTRFVLIVIFWGGNRFTSLSKAWYPGKAILTRCFPGAHQHPSSNPTKFMDGSHKTVVQENSCPFRCDLELELRCDCGKLGSRIFLHCHMQDDVFLRLPNHLLSEIH